MRSARPWPRSVALAFISIVLGTQVAHAQAAENSAVVKPSRSAVGVGEPPEPLRGPRLHWDPRWRKVDLEHYILFSVGIGLSLGKFALGPREDGQRGGVLGDESLRSTLRIRNLRSERFARDASDVLLASLLSYPFFDALVVAGWYRQSPTAAQQIALISAEALGVTAGLHAIANIALSRERPYGRLCGSDKPADGRDCDSPTRYFSFFSGHASQAFTAAGAICMHHTYMPLYGGGGADMLTCGASLTFASVTALLRVVGDQHYVTDVAVGALVGTLSGLGVPWLLHYRHGEPAAPSASRDRFRVRLLPTPTGAALFGSFP